MAATMENSPCSVLGRALVDFSTQDTFPEESVSSLALKPQELPAAIQALAETKGQLEAEIHTITEETATEVNAWLNTAKQIQEDTNRAKAWANDIVKLSEAPDVSGESVRQVEEKADFLVKELDYNTQLQRTLRAIKGVNQLLDEIQQASRERQVLHALHLLEKSWTAMDAVPVNKSCRPMKLLNNRAFQLKSSVHEVFAHVWDTLVSVDQDAGKVTVLDSDESMSLPDAVVGLKAYKEVDKRMMQLWHDLDAAVVAPRTDLSRPTLPKISVSESSIEIGGEADRSIEALFTDLEQVFEFLAKKLPSDLVQAMSRSMVPEVVSRIVSVWLSSVVPASLEGMDAFEQVIAATKRFCDRLGHLGFSGLDELQEWASNAPRVWLSKCRETALDTVRTRLSQGLGTPKEVTRVETHVLSRSEEAEITGQAPSNDNQGWDAAWSDGEHEETSAAPTTTNPAAEAQDTEDDGADAWGAWGDEDDQAEDHTDTSANVEAEPKPDEDDAADAWGWGEEDDQDKQEQEKTASQPLQSQKKSKSPETTREMTLKEIYHISSLPEPVLAIVFAILEDGASLTSSEHAGSPVAAAAAGLFSLPTLALAMFRAVGPYYYAFDAGGNMFLYNDTVYLAERLSDFAKSWKEREDLSPRGQAMLRLDNEIKTLQNFANRSYSNEMNMQKTIIRDHLGGVQNVLQQDNSEDFVDAAIARVRSVALIWESILARSTWYQALGSLVDALSSKIINDVMEMPSIGQDEAYKIANLIAKVTELDDLFLPSRAQGSSSAQADEIPATAQYTSTWLRLKYLSEVLQSNLREVRYLWMDSELSLYFTAEEVVDLVNLSFEDNQKSREIIREIKQNPHPAEM